MKPGVLSHCTQLILLSGICNARKFCLSTFQFTFILFLVFKFGTPLPSQNLHSQKFLYTLDFFFSLQGIDKLFRKPNHHFYYTICKEFLLFVLHSHERISRSSWAKELKHKFIWHKNFEIQTSGSS